MGFLTFYKLRGCFRLSRFLKNEFEKISKGSAVFGAGEVAWKKNSKMLQTYCIKSTLKPSRINGCFWLLFVFVLRLLARRRFLRQGLGIGIFSSFVLRHSLALGSARCSGAERIDASRKLPSRKCFVRATFCRALTYAVLSPEPSSGVQLS
jgi:hypothetical protein